MLFLQDGYITHTHKLIKVNLCQNGRGIDFKQDIVEYTGKNCFIPTSGYCFLKCINHLSDQDYMNDFLTFIRDQQRRSNVMTSARIQPFCKIHNINIVCYDGYRVCPINITERNIAVFMYKNRFCLIWKSHGVSFNKAIEELKLNVKVVDNVISDKHVGSFIKNQYEPEKFQPQLTNMIVYDRGTFNTDRANPYSICICKLSKISGKNIRDITEREQEKCRKDCVVVKGTDRIINMLNHNSQFKGEAKRVNNKIVYDKL